MTAKLSRSETSSAAEPDKIRRKPERPGEILAAAFDEFVQCGYSATRLEDVAKRAGVTKGTIYFHFRNKEQVFIQTVREFSKPLVEKTEKFFRDKPDDIIEFVEGYLEFCHRLVFEDKYTREIIRLLISEAVRFPELVDEHFNMFIEPIFDHLRKELGAAAEAGTVRPSPALKFPDLLLSPVLALHIFLLLFSDRRPLDPTLHLKAAKDLLLNGLLPRD